MGGVTIADFDLLTLRLLKQALRQLFCKICLPRENGEREREREREGERKGDRQRKRAGKAESEGVRAQC